MDHEQRDTRDDAYFYYFGQLCDDAGAILGLDPETFCNKMIQGDLSPEQKDTMEKVVQLVYDISFHPTMYVVHRWVKEMKIRLY